MSETPGASSTDVRADRPARLASVDVLRGLAISWVLLFHLWVDMKLVAAPPADYYHRFWDRLVDGELARLGTSLTDALFRIGFQGVPLFMMLSGFSLYLAAASRPTFDAGAFYRTRLRRIMVPYWAGFVVFMLGVVAVVLTQMALHDGSFAFHYHSSVTAAAYHRIDIGWSDALASLALFPRVVRDEWFGVPPGSLWFVVIIVQYYALFPLLRRVLDHVGPWWFAGGALVLTVIAKGWLIATYGGLEQPTAFRLDSGVVLFRSFDFALGMTLGYVFVRRRTLVDEYIGSKLDIAGLLFLGFLLQVGGTLLDDRQAYINTLGAPMVVAGLTLMVVPLIAREPARLLATAPARLIAWIGVISYAVLIVNEPIRLVASMLRLEDIPSAAWWLFLTCVYVPATLILAWPFAVLVGLVPGRRDSVTAKPMITPPVELEMPRGAAPAD
jgi:peptidoglycan/LPS O-acetylase OafA/YrhL